MLTRCNPGSASSASLRRLHFVELQPPLPNPYTSTRLEGFEESIRQQLFLGRGGPVQQPVGPDAWNFQAPLFEVPSRLASLRMGPGDLPGHERLRPEAGMPVPGSQTLVESVRPQAVFGEDCPWQAPVWVW